MILASVVTEVNPLFLGGSQFICNSEMIWWLFSSNKIYFDLDFVERNVYFSYYSDI